jgi:hypothetical protein
MESPGDMVSAFNERLWSMAVESVTVNTVGGLTFLFKDGTKILA